VGFCEQGSGTSVSMGFVCVAEQLLASQEELSSVS
jgi:hypothetical protein